MSARVSRRTMLAGVAASSMASSIPARAQSKDPIKIGELNSYTRLAAFCMPYRNAMQLALDEINGKGGVLGRRLEFVIRDDGGTTGDATRVAEELVTRENVSML